MYINLDLNLKLGSREAICLYVSIHIILNRLESQIASCKILNIYNLFLLQFLTLGSLRLLIMEITVVIYFALIPGKILSDNCLPKSVY